MSMSGTFDASTIKIPMRGVVPPMPVRDSIRPTSEWVMLSIRFRDQQRERVRDDFETRGRSADIFAVDLRVNATAEIDASGARDVYAAHFFDLLRGHAE